MREGDERMDGEKSYYDISMLKTPLWEWMVPTYFWLGGISAASYLLARMADRFGGPEHRTLARTGINVGVAALVPCPPLLILDLGDPRRFHHMLRIVKLGSPMSVGSWALTGYSGALAVAALREWTGRRGPVSRVLMAMTDAAGVPTALLMITYSGVLLSTTSTPVWSRNPWIGVLFCAGAFEAASSAVSLALGMPELLHPGRPASRAQHSVERIGAITRVLEGAALAGYLNSARDLARPLTTGRYALPLWGGAVGAGIVLPALLEAIPVESKRARLGLRLAGATLGLIGGLALRWSVVMAGHESARDPAAARKASRRQSAG